MAWFFRSRTFGNAVASVPPGTPTLAVADHRDNTGGTANITGADATAAISIFSQSVDGQLGSVNWILRASRTGNGDVSFAVPAGYYWFKAESNVSGSLATSNLVYQNITAGETAVLYRCLRAVQSRLQLLALADIAGSEIIVQKLPLDRALGSATFHELPAVLVSPEQESMDPHAGVNQRDDVGYGVRVTLVDRDNQERTREANLDKFLLWREQIARAFRQQRLSGVPEIYTCIVEPDQVVGSDAWTKNLFASSLVLRFLSRERRGM